MDGAGKSTQIENLRAALQSMGFRVRVFTFWDDVVVFSKAREQVTVKAFKSEKGVGTPERPVERRDKNVRAWYLTMARHGLYVLDALHLRKVVNSALKSGSDVVIVDRYIYDELANLPLERPATRAFVRFIETIVPLPDVAYLLDADPEAAHARKPEYPVDFMHKCRAAYYRLASLLGTMTVIPALPLPEAKQAVVTACDKTILVRELGTTNSPSNRGIGVPAA